MKRTLFFAACVTAAALILPTPRAASQTIAPYGADAPAASAQDLTILAFTSPNCPACNRIKADQTRLVNAGFKLQVVDAQTIDGLANARSYKVTELPTYVVVDGAVEVGRVTYREMCASGCYSATVAALQAAKKKIARTLVDVASVPFRIGAAAIGTGVARRSAVVVRTDSGYRVRYIDRAPAYGYVVNVRERSCEPSEISSDVRPCDPAGACATVESVEPCEPVARYDEPVDPCDPVERLDWEPVATPFTSCE